MWQQSENVVPQQSSSLPGGEVIMQRQVVPSPAFQRNPERFIQARPRPVFIFTPPPRSHGIRAVWWPTSFQAPPFFTHTCIMMSWLSNGFPFVLPVMRTLDETTAAFP